MCGTEASSASSFLDESEGDHDDNEAGDDDGEFLDHEERDADVSIAGKRVTRSRPQE